MLETSSKGRRHVKSHSMGTIETSAELALANFLDLGVVRRRKVEEKMWPFEEPAGAVEACWWEQWCCSSLGLQPE